MLRASNSGEISYLLDGIKWALDNDVDIISLSLYTEKYNQNLHDLIKCATVKNKVVICSAGNRGNDYLAVNFPAKFAETISVGSIDRHLFIQDSSSRGCEVDFVAPGVNIYSTSAENGYGYGHGTSFAAPFIAGMSALILSKHRSSSSNQLSPVRNVHDLREHLMKICVDLGLFGKDPVFGYGAPFRWNTLSLWDLLSVIRYKDFTPTGRIKLKRFLNQIIQK